VILAQNRVHSTRCKFNIEAQKCFCLFLPAAIAAGKIDPEHGCAPGFSMKSRFARKAGGSRNGLRPKIQATRFAGGC
jgi:hypothetical protein